MPLLNCRNSAPYRPSSRISDPFYSRSRDSFALVAVLAFVVLLTILVIGFLGFNGLNRNSTASYSESVAAQEIAQGGLEDILSDLHNEIIAGSTVINTNASGVAYANTNATVYIPVTNFTAVPARIGYGASYWGTDISTGTFSPTLIRVSRAMNNSSTYAGASFYTATPPYYSMANVPGGAILDRASTNSAGTATPSVNGRYVSTARWNKTFLLATNTASVPAPFTNASPDWVYVTRTGSRACAQSEIASLLPSSTLGTNYGTITPGVNPPASPILGRYAYVMYDEGALLDANVAGYLSSATNSTSATPTYTNTAPVNYQTLSGKSYLSYADLTQLPGLSQAAVDALVNWRNAGGIANGNNGGTGNTYLGAMFNYAQNGFLSFTNSGTGTYDSPLVSRQDLINYFANYDANHGTTTSQALPYLGTFTREVNAPSYFPPFDATAIPNYTAGAASLSTVPTYHTSMENSSTGSTTTIANRDFANVRFASTGTVTHYSDAAATSTYTVAVGDPLVQRRFSLSRIAWLSQTWAGEPDPGTTSSSYGSSVYPAPIQACFGLVWDYPGATSGTAANGGNKCWNYVGSTLTTGGGFAATSSSPASTIETLAQVAAENPPREPNFFELLKAAILNGSLGLSPGTAAEQNATLNATGFYNIGGVKTAPNADGPAGLFCYSFDGHWSTHSGISAYAPATVPDCQIIQIGANIISQFSADSYPTAIYFKYPTVGVFDAANGISANPIYGPVDIFYGDENLPQITRMYQIIASTLTAGDNNPTDTTDYTVSTGSLGTTTLTGWMQPELWNIHQQPGTALFPSGQNFRIKAYGSVQLNWTSGGTIPSPWTAGEGSGKANQESWFQTDAQTETDSDGAATINFTDSSTTSSFYLHPFLLTKDTIPTTTSPTVSVPAASNAAVNIAPTTTAEYSLISNTSPITATEQSPNLIYNHVVGFWAGTTSTATPPGTGPNYVFWTSSGPSGQFGIEPVATLGGPQGIAAEPLGCTSYALGWVDSNSNFHPYSFMAGVFPYAAATIAGKLSCDGGCDPDLYATSSYAYVDPRTSRFSFVMGQWSAQDSPLSDTSFQHGAGAIWPAASYFDADSCMPIGATPTTMATPTGTGFYPQLFTSGASAAGFPEDWMINSSTCLTAAGETSTAPKTAAYYADPDGVIRPADGYYGNITTFDGLPDLSLPTNNGAPTPASGFTFASGDKGGNVSHGRRPVILNRPFRSVGELGYTFRDLPFKTLDFFSSSSADAGLLDVFSITDEPKVVAGRINLSNATPEVIQAVLNGGAKKEDYDPTYNMKSEVTNIASAITSILNPSTGPVPMLNRAELVTRLMSGSGTLTTPGTPNSPSMLNAFTSSPDKGNKTYFEAPVRALADVTNTRTWNLLIDIIAQSGHLSPAATSLDNFVVTGEKRYWLHIAIDRYTGKIVDQQLEPVYE